MPTVNQILCSTQSASSFDMYGVSDIIPAHNSCFSPPSIYFVLYILLISRECGIFLVVFICPSSRPFFVFLFPFLFLFSRDFKMQWIYAFPGATSTSTPAGGAAAAKSAQHFLVGRPPWAGQLSPGLVHTKNQTQYIPTYTHTHTQRFFLLLRILSSRNPSVFFVCACVSFHSLPKVLFHFFLFYLSPPKIKIRGGFAAPSI